MKNTITEFLKNTVHGMKNTLADIYKNKLEK